MTPEAAREALSVFLGQHPQASIEEIGNRVVVANPWSDPSLMFLVPKRVDSFADALNSLRLFDKFSGVYHRDTAEFEVLWTAFTFDGGFVVKPLVGAGETESTFCTRTAQFADSIRKIRNTLSHGKEQETAGIILPTTRNFNLLRPWLHLIATAAGEVVLHKDVT